MKITHQQLNNIINDGQTAHETSISLPMLIPGNWIKWIMLSGNINSGIILSTTQVTPTNTQLHILTSEGEQIINSNLIFKLKIIQ
jgi:hypothetical protein